MYAEGGFYTLMGHPQIIGRPSRMRMLERLIRQILGKKDIWFAKPLEVAEFWLERAYRQDQGPSKIRVFERRLCRATQGKVRKGGEAPSEFIDTGRSGFSRRPRGSSGRR